ncbi:MAG: hypothetical protein RLZZ242_564 [Bacteroidota bacterium]
MAARPNVRQRMINLMYLVFIAMLAMNMSKEVLSAFGLLNEKLELSVSKAEQTNESYLGELALRASENKAKFGALYENALTLDGLSGAFSSELETLKRSLLESVSDPMDYEVMDTSDALDRRFFKGEQLKEEGAAFVTAIDTYRDSVLSLIGETNPELRAAVQTRFDTGDAQHEVTNREGQRMHWLRYNFEGFPLIASITKISALISDVKATEQEVLQSLLQGQLTAEVAMTNYTTLLEQSKGAFFSDETFDGAIVLGRKDATTRPNTVNLSLDGQPLQAGRDFEIEDGRVRLKVAAGNPGDHTLTGTLVFLESGEQTEVPVNLRFSTIAKPNMAVISADKMNVVYRGVDNPITVSIPGIPDNKVEATAPGLKKISGSSYSVRPGQGTELVIQASGELPDGSRVQTSTRFRIKDVPAPSGTVRGESGSLRMSPSELENTFVGARLEDFDFDLPIKVSGFKIKLPNQPTIEVNGDRLDTRAKAAVRRATRGDIVRIFDIKTAPANDTRYFLKPASQVIIEIVN